MKQRQAVTAVTVQRYRKAGKKVKQQILDEFCETTGYCRGYARFVLRNHGRQVWRGGKRVVVGVVNKPQQRLKPRYYDEQVVQELSKLWQLLDCICGKRLVVIMPELIAKLEQFGELRLARSTKEKLLQISAASIDRLLQAERRKHQLRQRSHTRLPFPLRGLDSDNGSEFINGQLLRYCQQQRITFTRARPYRKNDNCYVEQKNYSVVRQTVGYQRFDTTAELLVLKQLYAQLRLYTNFFQPTMKLKSKERLGSRVKKSYHAPQTPYQRVLTAETVSAAAKKKLKQQYRLLNPAALKRAIDKYRKELFRLATKKHPVLKRQRHRQQPLTIKPELLI